MLIVLVGGYLVCLARIPHLANPFFVIEAIKKKEIGEDTIRVLAAMAPILFSLSAMVLGVLVATILCVVGIEKKYLKIVDGLRVRSTDDLANPGRRATDPPETPR